jgi:DNA-binding XRE family transcriptional regulator
MDMNKLRRHMSATIRTLRKDFRCQCGKPECCNRGLSQAELAKSVGVPTNTVSRWETGVYWPAPYDLFNLAEYLQVPVATFFPAQKSAIRALKDGK